jgi:hypothetical protein
MLHQGARVSGGNIDGELSSKIESLLDQFVTVVAREVETQKIRRAIVRSMLTCDVIIVLDAEHLWVAAQKQSTMGSTLRAHLKRGKKGCKM